MVFLARPRVLGVRAPVRQGAQHLGLAICEQVQTRVRRTWLLGGEALLGAAPAGGSG